MKKLFFLLLLIGLVSAKSFYFDSVQASYNIQPDGLIQVQEKLDFNFDGQFSYAYRYWDSSDVYNIRVFEEKNGLLTETSFEKQGNRITWHYSAINERKTFVLKYDLSNAISQYDDLDEFYWKLWPDDWDAPVTDFEGTIIFPKTISNPEIWAYSDVNGVWRHNGNTVFFEFENIPRKTFVEARILFDKNTLNSDARVQRKQGSVLEQVQNNEFFSYWITEFFTYYPYAMLLILALFFYKYYREYGREPKVEKQFSGGVETVFDDEPFVVDYLINHEITEKAITATLLGLVYKKIIAVRKTRVKTLFGLSSTEDFELVISQKKLGLNEPEEKLLDFLTQNGTSDGKTTVVLLSELKKNSSKRTISFLSEWSQSVKTEFKSNPDKLIDNTGNNKFAIVSLVFIGLTVLLTIACVLINDSVFERVGFSLFASFFVSMFSLIIPLAFKKTLARRTQLGAEKYAKWMAFKDYLDRFPTFKKKEASQIQLYEKFLVYATVLGNAEKVLSSFKSSFTEQQKQQSSMYAISSYHGFSSFNNAFASSSSASMSSGSSSSGGGGGGGSGGGGAG